MTNELETLRAQVSKLEADIGELAVQNLELINTLTFVLRAANIDRQVGGSGPPQLASDVLDRIFDAVYSIADGHTG